MSRTHSYSCPYCGSTNRHRNSSNGTIQRCTNCGRKYRLNTGMSCLSCLIWIVFFLLIIPIAISILCVIINGNKLKENKNNNQISIKSIEERTAEERQGWLRKFDHVWTSYDAESLTVRENEWKKLTTDYQDILCLTVVQVVNKTPRNKGARGNYKLKVFNQNGEQIYLWE